MELYAINCGYFKLDGGAMFGVVPKSLWQKKNSSDENNMCTWALRCLLIKTEDRLILVDNGMGNKQSEKFFSYYYPHGDDTLETSLKKHGFTCSDITDVILTHLHFDHCGGSVQWNRECTGYETTFPNAVYWTNKSHWDWALNPNAREKASFLKENLLPIQEAEQLAFINPSEDVFHPFLPEISIYFTRGHTENMMLPIIHHPSSTLIYMADLIPSAAHIPMPWIMSYDLRPLLTLKEKEFLLNYSIKNNCILFFEHDPVSECCNLILSDRGIVPDNSGKLIDFFA